MIKILTVIDIFTIMYVALIINDLRLSERRANILRNKPKSNKPKLKKGQKIVAQIENNNPFGE